MLDTRRVAAWLQDKGLLHLLPWRFLRWYVHPLLLPRRRRPSDTKAYWESWYRSTADVDFQDALSISPRTSSLTSRFHYNGVENSIIRFFQRHPAAAAPRVLDVGSGTGHWVDFYLHAFGAVSVTAAEFSDECVGRLRERFAGDPRVTVHSHDITDPLPADAGPFDMVNAIGVMFHIVEDDRWEEALKNIHDVLSPGGYAVMGGLFGLITSDVQIHGTDSFGAFDDQYERREVSLVNKRLRSRFRWKRAARRAGLTVEALVRTRGDARIVTPENHVLVLRKPLSGA